MVYCSSLTALFPPSFTSPLRPALRVKRSSRARALTPRSPGGPIIVYVFPVPVYPQSRGEAWPMSAAVGAAAGRGGAGR